MSETSAGFTADSNFQHSFDVRLESNTSRVLTYSWDFDDVTLSPAQFC
jgi:hypothetical protein